MARISSGVGNLGMQDTMHAGYPLLLRDGGTVRSHLVLR